MSKLITMHKYQTIIHNMKSDPSIRDILKQEYKKDSKMPSKDDSTIPRVRKNSKILSLQTPHHAGGKWCHGWCMSVLSVQKTQTGRGTIPI